MNAVWSAPGRFRPAASVRRMRLGGRSLLFCERRQQLFELNPTADLVWDALLDQPPPSAAHLLAAALHLDREQIQGHVQGQLAQWLGDGLWEPVEPWQGAVAAEARLRLAVDALRAEIQCDDSAMLGRLRMVFGQFPDFAGAPTTRFRITPWADGFHLYENDNYVGALPEEAVVPQVKALLTERVAGRRFGGFFAHGALLARDATLAMLSGSPGAGKSTLALALQAAGWQLWADDLIRVDASARFRGVPFAPAIKEGAWALLRPWLPELPQWPVDRRSDGKKVRYAASSPSAQKPRPLNLFLILDRRDEAKAHAVTVDPVEGLSALLAEAFSARGRISADLMARLAERFQTVSCRRLVYGALEEAVDAIETLRRDL